MGTRGTYQRTALGITLTLATLAALLGVLLPFRDHLSIAIPALVFVLPAVVGVVAGGFVAGAVGALAGFVTYDYFFLPPYGTLAVHYPQHLSALLVYLVVVLIVARVVASARASREKAVRRTEESLRLYELSRALIGDLSAARLGTHIVDAVQGVAAPRWTALVTPEDGHDDRLAVAAAAGEPLSVADHAALTSSGGRTASLGLVATDAPTRVSLALAVANRPVGMLVLDDVRLTEEDRRVLGTFANQAALAIDRARLRDEALRAQLLEEIDRWRSALMGAASHDLRTPLASIKTAVSSLRRRDVPLAPEDRAELLELIELQSDRLARLVSNLLDMTRIEAGALEVRPVAMAFGELVDEAVDSLGGIVEHERISVVAPAELPLLQIDHVLVSQVLANLLENAERLAPRDSTITVAARVAPGSSSTRAEISVADEGPGIGHDDRERVFEMFNQNGGGGRAGLGLAIAKAFVEAHGGLIWIDPDVRRGARVVFTIPCAAPVPAAL